MSLKRLSKRLIKGLFRLIIFPFFLLFCLMARLGNTDSVFRTFSQLLSLFPGKTGSYLRAAFYCLVCPNTSDEVFIGFLTIFSHRDTTIKRGVYIGPQCNIGKCTIGEDTLVGSGVHILSGKNQHNFFDLDTPIQQQGGHFTKLEIGSDCWIGNNATVLAPIASHSIVAAASVVTKDVGSSVIVAGQPAKVIKTRN